MKKKKIIYIKNVKNVKNVYKKSIEIIASSASLT